MAKKPGAFDHILAKTPSSAPQAATPSRPAAQRAPSGMLGGAGHGPLGALNGDLRTSAERMIRELPCGDVFPSAHHDRFSTEDDGTEALAASIQEHGQQVPILVRPHPTLSGKYEVIYGRRRLEAVKRLGLPVRALVRKLADDEAILAAGHENNLRRDPSYIEKASWAHSLVQDGYDRPLLMSALAVDKAMISKMLTATRVIPHNVIEMIGPCPSVGRRRWDDAVNLIDKKGADPQVALRAIGEEMTSDARFDAWLAALALTAPDAESAKPVKPKPTPRGVQSSDGTSIGKVTPSAGGNLKIEPDKNLPEFAAWLEGNIDEALQSLYNQWKSNGAS